MKHLDWLGRPHAEWPAEARTAFSILAIGAERLLKDEAEQRARGQAPATGTGAA